MHYRLILLLTIIAGMALLLSQWPPLGVDGEWVWRRHVLPVDLPEALDRLLWPILCGMLVVIVADLGLRQVETAGRIHRGLLLLALTGVSFFWLNAVRQAAPSPHRELRPLWILYDKYASGYFYEATLNVTSTSEMLAGYEAKMAKGDVLHEGTHPPGLLLLNRGLLALTESSPAVVNLSEGLQDGEAARMFRDLETAARMARPLSRPEFAALHLSSLLSTLIAAMTVIPIFGLTRRLSDSTTAWRAAVLMITVPTIGIFVPRSDVLYPCTGMMLAWATVTSLLADHRLERWMSSLLAGTALFCCLLLSLAHVPIVVMLAMFGFGRALLDVRNHLLKNLEANVLAAATFLLFCGVFQLATDCNLFSVWRMNLTNHAGFYAQSVRTWSAWILVNPIELAMSVGLPLACVAVMAVARILRQCRASGFTSVTNLQLFVLACALTWALLWLSGKNMGEAARLWCFLTPWMAIAAADEKSRVPESDRMNWCLLLIAQLIVATVTVGRVSGYLQL